MAFVIKSKDIDAVEWEHKLHGSDINWIIRQREGLIRIRDNLEQQLIEKEGEMDQFYAEEIVPVDDTICGIDDQLLEVEARLEELGYIVR